MGFEINILIALTWRERGAAQTPAMAHIGWCSVCRGDAESNDDLIKCHGCKLKFHLNCAGLRAWPEAKAWKCAGCADGALVDNKKSTKHRKRIHAVRVAHKELKVCASGFYERSKAALAPFIAEEALAKLAAGGKAILKKAKPLVIGLHYHGQFS